MMEQCKEKLSIAMFGQKRIPSREGGVEIVVEELCTRMVAQGHNVTCYNRGGHHVSGSEYDSKRLKEYKGIKLKTVPTIEKKGLAAVSSSFFAALCCAFGKYDVVHIHAEGPAFFCWLGEALEQHGHEVQYFGMEHEGRCVGNRINAYTSDMDFHGGSKLSKLTYPIKTIYSKEARVQLRKVLDDFKPDVCHLNNFNYQLTPSIILEIVKWRKETVRDCKIVFTAHDYQLVCPNHMLNNPNIHQNCEKCLGGHFVNCMKGKCIHGSTAKSAIGMMEAEFWKWKGTYKYIDTMICCSEFMKSKMDSNPLFATKTVAMHNFIDKVEWKETEKKDYVLYFGRFSEEKGIGTLIKVCKELPDVQFIFAGTGPLEETVNGIKNIKNVGFQKGEALEKLIREARFSIYPSEWYENCPFSVMESQMYGTPVLGANIGGIPELIQVGKTGELFKSGDGDELKSKIQKLWGDKELCDEYSKNCKGISFDTIDEYYEKIMKVYQ